MKRPSLSLWVVLALVLAALFPVIIGRLQLVSHREALLDQVQRLQLLAASTTAARIGARLGSLQAAAETVAASSLVVDAESEAAQELLVGLLQAQSEVVAAVIVDGEGGEIVKAQRSELAAEITAALVASPSADVAVAAGLERRWLRLEQPLATTEGRLALVVDLEALADEIETTSLLGNTQAVLVSQRGSVLLGDPATLSELPSELSALARSGRLIGGAGRYRNSAGQNVIAAHHPVAGTPWLVVARQPQASVDQAAARMRRATFWATAGALGLALLLSALGYRFLVLPLRRLVRAQASMAGIEDITDEGTEIAQLESAFVQLMEIEHDRESIGEVFLGRYQVLGSLGTGGSGTVFRGYDPVLAREVALKTVRLPIHAQSAEELVTRLQVEAVHAARLNHPNIVTVHDFEQRGDTAYIAMEKIDGITLAEYLRRGGSLEIEDAIGIGRAMAAALTAAHAQQLVHGDFKPSNVMLGRDGAIKVTDFGTSRLIQRAGERHGQVVGTPGYVAPEVLRGKGNTPASDLFACGVVLFEMLTGARPFGGGDLGEILRRTRKADAPAVGDLRQGVPAELESLIARLLTKDPAERLASAELLAERLARLQVTSSYGWRPDPTVMEADEDRSGSPTGDFTTRVLTPTSSAVNLQPTGERGRS